MRRTEMSQLLFALGMLAVLRGMLLPGRNCRWQLPPRPGRRGSST